MFEMPDLTKMSLAELRELFARVREEGTAEFAKGAEADFEILEALADAKEAIETRISEVEAAEAEADALSAAKAARFASVFAIEDAAKDAVGRSGDTEVPGAEDDAPAAEEPADPAGESDVKAEASDDTEVETPAPVSFAARPSAKTRLANANEQRPAALDPATSTLAAGELVAASSFSRPGVKSGEVMSKDQVVDAITHMVRNRAATSAVSDRKHLFTTKLPVPAGRDLKPGEPEHNDAVLARLASQRRADLANASQMSMDSLVASGGSCAPLTPRYGIAQFGSPHTPVWDSLDVTTDDGRGGVSYTEMPDATYLSGGLLLNTCDNATAKPFVQVNQCPTMRDICVRPLSQRLRFDNQLNRTYREFIEWSMTEFTKIEAATREVFMLNRIIGESVAAVPVNTKANYGATRSTLQYILSIAHNVRKRNGLNIGANATVLDMYCPDAFVEVLQADMIADGFMGSQFLSMPTVVVRAEVLRKFKINMVEYYYDATTAGFPASSHAGAGVADWQLPTVGRFIFSVPGSLARIDGGELDFGLIVDSTLNNTNDVEYFSEQWFELMRPGLKPVQYDITFCMSGSGPAAVPGVC